MRTSRALLNGPLPDGVDEDQAISAVREELFQRGFLGLRLAGEEVAFAARWMRPPFTLSEMLSKLVAGGSVRVAGPRHDRHLRLEVRFRRGAVGVCLATAGFLA